MDLGSGELPPVLFVGDPRFGDSGRVWLEATSCCIAEGSEPVVRLTRAAREVAVGGHGLRVERVRVVRSRIEREPFACAATDACAALARRPLPAPPAPAPPARVRRRAGLRSSPQRRTTRARAPRPRAWSCLR